MKGQTDRNRVKPWKGPRLRGDSTWREKKAAELHASTDANQEITHSINGIFYTEVMHVNFRFAVVNRHKGLVLLM